MNEEKEKPKAKSPFHRFNKHQGKYDFQKLTESHPDLLPFASVNKYNNISIDFFNPEAVKHLNIALLKTQYKLKYWDIPEGYLTPPIPGRADHIHHLADLLAKNFNGQSPKGKRIKCLDIGAGSNCIYPIIANKEYYWTIVASEIDPIAIDNANKILSLNDPLSDFIEIRYQKDPKNILKGIIKEDEKFDLTFCNPPFYGSPEEVQQSSKRKLKNLKAENHKDGVKNFGGQSNELWCEGGELQFVLNLIEESKAFAQSCFWFTSLISKEAHLKPLYAALSKAKAYKVHTLKMSHGNKKSRIIAWTFLKKGDQNKWVEKRWRIRASSVHQNKK